MDFEWDETKAKLNIAKYGVSFEEAKSVFCDEFGIVIFDDEYSSDEDRFLLLGKSLKDRILLVVHCYKENNLIRIISARKATAKEKTYYKGQK